jgi:hypothetical protein
VWAAGEAPCIYSAVWCASLWGRSPNGTHAKPERRDKVLQNGAKRTGRRQLRTRIGGWRSGRDAGCFVGTIVVGYAHSDCAFSVAAPLLVPREAAVSGIGMRIGSLVVSSGEIW